MRALASGDSSRERYVNILSNAARVHVSIRPASCYFADLVRPVATQRASLIQYSIREGRDDVSHVSLQCTLGTGPATLWSAFSSWPRRAGETANGRHARSRNVARLSGAREANFPYAVSRSPSRRARELWRNLRDPSTRWSRCHCLGWVTFYFWVSYPRKQSHFL